MQDNEIVDLFLSRDEKAIKACEEKYHSYCFSIAKDILENTEDAEECVNDAFLQAWNSIPPATPHNLATYLGKLVRNQSINLYRKNTAEKRGSGRTPLILEELSELIPDSNSPEDYLDKKLLTESINSFLATLPVKKRKIFVCRYWYSESVKDIARRFKVSENSISLTLNRLRTKLRHYLTERGIEI